MDMNIVVSKKNHFDTNVIKIRIHVFQQKINHLYLATVLLVVKYNLVTGMNLPFRSIIREIIRQPIQDE